MNTFGFEHIEVGNNAVGITGSIIYRFSAFRNELISPFQRSSKPARSTTNPLEEWREHDN